MSLIHFFLQYDFNDPVWDGISTEAKDVIVKLLKPDPTDRISLKEFLGSPWIAKDTSSAENAVLVNRLKKFNLGTIISPSRRISCSTQLGSVFLNLFLIIPGRVKLRALILAKLASKKFINSRSNKKNKGGAGAFASDLASPRDGPASPTPHTEFDDVVECSSRHSHSRFHSNFCVGCHCLLRFSCCLDVVSSLIPGYWSRRQRCVLGGNQ